MTRGDVYTESFFGLIPLCDCFEEFKDRFQAVDIPDGHPFIKFFAGWIVNIGEPENYTTTLPVIWVWCFSIVSINKDHTFLFFEGFLFIEFGMSFNVLLDDLEVFGSEFEGYLGTARFFVFIGV